LRFNTLAAAKGSHLFSAIVRTIGSAAQPQRALNSPQTQLWSTWLLGSFPIAFSHIAGDVNFLKVEAR
jgi:hypothetical protein